MSTPFRQGLKKVYLPNITFKMVRAPNLQPNQVAFRVPPSCNKFDIHSYLTNIYGVNVQEVRTMNYQTEYKKTRRNKFEVAQPKYKKAIVTLDEAFDYPSEPEWCRLDLDEFKLGKESAKNKLKGWRFRHTTEVREQKKDIYQQRLAQEQEKNKKSK